MMPRPPVTVEPTSFILKTSVKGLFVALNAFAVYLTLKGHNAPGGGFIGGLVSALSLVLVSMVLGVDRARRLMRIDPLLLTFFGLGLAYGTALAPALFGHAFFRHFAFELDVPGFGHLHLLTAQLFDFGVYFVVVGVTAKIIVAFSLSVQLRDPFDEEKEAPAYAAPGESPIEEAAWEAEAAGSEGVESETPWRQP